MRIKIKLFSGLKPSKELDKDEKGAYVVEVQGEKTVAQLIEEIGLTGEYKVVVLNSVILKDLNVKVKNGDELSIFPALGGG